MAMALGSEQTAGVASVRAGRWPLAIGLALGLATLYTLLGDRMFRGGPKQWIVFAPGPLAAAAIAIYLTVVASAERPPESRPSWRRVIAGIGLLGVITGLSYAIYNERATQSGVLAVVHLPALAWLVLGMTALPPQASDAPNRFAAVLKSAEVLVVGQLIAGTGAVFVAVTMMLFSAIDVKIPNEVIRRLPFFGGGLVPVLAVAIAYDPARLPAEQRTDQGLARIIFSVARIFLPLTVLVLAVYTLMIPFRFLEPVQKREVLMIYNAMLFAVMFLLVVVTPRAPGELGPRVAPWLRRGVLVTAGLAALVGLHAMIAVLSRTMTGGLTPNRATVIGWNLINIGLLAWFLLGALRTSGDGWIDVFQDRCRRGLYAYTVWTLVVLIMIAPWGVLGGH